MPPVRLEAVILANLRHPICRACRIILSLAIRDSISSWILLMGRISPAHGNAWARISEDDAIIVGAAMCETAWLICTRASRPPSSVSSRATSSHTRWYIFLVILVRPKWFKATSHHHGARAMRPGYLRQKIRHATHDPRTECLIYHGPHIYARCAAIIPRTAWHAGDEESSSLLS